MQTCNTFCGRILLFFWTFCKNLDDIHGVEPGVALLSKYAGFVDEFAKCSHSSTAGGPLVMAVVDDASESSSRDHEVGHHLDR